MKPQYEIEILHIHLNPRDEWILSNMSEEEKQNRVGRSNSKAVLQALQSDKALIEEGIILSPVMIDVIDEHTAEKVMSLFQEKIRAVGSHKKVLLAITGKDGAGKSTLEENLLPLAKREKINGTGDILTISTTTRPIREAEVKAFKEKGKRAYFFVDSLEEMKKKDMIEINPYAGNYYGVEREQVMGRHTALVIEFKGLVQVMRALNSYNAKLKKEMT